MNKITGLIGIVTLPLASFFVAEATPLPAGLKLDMITIKVKSGVKLRVGL